jgi:quinoprotein glucose dehydrogenase
VDLNRGEIAWRVPLGVVDELAARGVPKTGIQSLGGAIVTAGGLVFIGGTVDRRFRAFDAGTGAELWSYRLPANAHANPMTFTGRDGRQYVVIAAGGGGISGDLSRTLSDTVLAFALPSAPQH